MLDVDDPHDVEQLVQRDGVSVQAMTIRPTKFLSLGRIYGMWAWLKGLSGAGTLADSDEDMSGSAAATGSTNRPATDAMVALPSLDDFLPIKSVE